MTNKKKLNKLNIKRMRHPNNTNYTEFYAHNFYSRLDTRWPTQYGIGLVARET